MDQFSRSSLLLGRDNINKLNNAHVAVFGVGGVGGYVCEALARTGVGIFDLIDNDTVSLTNINRQIIATYDTVGKDKVDVMKDRILSINPNALVRVHKTFVLPENISDFDFKKYDYVIDCIDTVSAKLALAVKCNELNVRIISSMGAGNKFDPMAFKIADINQTSGDPLARVMRYELKKRDIKHLKVCYSTELKATPVEESEEELNGARRAIPGSLAFVPSACGLLIASEVIKDLIK
ncbi:MAG: tRNA threonylcarbamoyladenosine dehydratase [Acholeplasmatales bacterium]|nr:tRNA threonylcarbamoyladenosine dehydratase [Acholeplasmatales bacterium]